MEIASKEPLFVFRSSFFATPHSDSDTLLRYRDCLSYPLAIVLNTRRFRHPLPSRTDIVPLDHLIERCRLDAEQLGCALLNTTRGLERRLDEPLLEVRDDILERDPFGRHHESRHLEDGRPTDVVGQ